MSSRLLLQRVSSRHLKSTAPPSTRLFSTSNSARKCGSTGKVTIPGDARKPGETPAHKKKAPHPSPNYIGSKRVWKNEKERKEFEELEKQAPAQNALFGAHKVVEGEDVSTSPHLEQLHQERSHQQKTTAVPPPPSFEPGHGGRSNGGRSSNGQKDNSSKSRPSNTTFGIALLTPLALISAGIWLGRNVIGKEQVVEYGEEGKFRTPKYAGVGEMEKVSSYFSTLLSICYTLQTEEIANLAYYRRWMR